MKRLICILLFLSLMLTGCVWNAMGLQSPVRFYYLRQQYQYGTADGVITAVERETAGHSTDLAYLMALYLTGPSEEGLVSPLPVGTRIYSADEANGTVTLTLSDTAKTLTESGFSLACACLALTSMEITGAHTVTIISGERSASITAEDLILWDDSATAFTETVPSS